MKQEVEKASSSASQYSHKLSQLVKPVEKRKPVEIREFKPVVNKKVDVSKVRSSLNTGIRRPMRRSLLKPKQTPMNSSPPHSLTRQSLGSSIVSP